MIAFMDARATNAYWGRSGLERAILEALTARLGLTDRVKHRVGHALALDVGADAFDVVWTQNSGMNIADKERLYAGFARVLRLGGLLALQEPMAGPVQPVVFPVMWARDAAASFLRAPGEMRAVIEAAGFQVRAWDDVDGVMALMTADCVFENTLPAPDGERFEGTAAVRTFWQRFFQSTPGARFETEEVFAVGDRGIVRWVFRWDDQGGRVRGVDVLRVRDGKVAEKLAYVKG